MNKKISILGVETGKIVCGIYVIKCIVNDKIYIGSSNNIGKRIRDGFKKLQNGTSKIIYLQDAFTEFGENNFVYELLELVENNNLGKRERYWIVELNTVYPNGFNGSLGGETGRRNCK